MTMPWSDCEMGSVASSVSTAANGAVDKEVG
jgi:hypothetical protein